MFKFLRERVTKTVTRGNQTTTETTEKTSTAPSAEPAKDAAEAQALLDEAAKLFAAADEIFAHPFFAGGPAPKAVAKPPDPPKAAEPAPDYLADTPPAERMIYFGTITGVFRYKGRYYRFQSGDATNGVEPAGYYALDRYMPKGGQP